MNNQENFTADLIPEFPLRTLFVEANPQDTDLYLSTLRTAHFEVAFDVVKTAQEFADQLRIETYDVILSAFNLDGWTGMDAVELLKRTPYDIPFILVTDLLGEHQAVECFRKGIADYVAKNDLDHLAPTVLRVLEEKALRSEKRQAERLLKASEARFSALVNAMPTAIFIEQATQCRYVNREAEEITGFTRAELLESNFWQMIVPSSKRALLDQVVGANSDGQSSSSYETQILTKTGEVRSLEVSVGVVRYDGCMAALITAMDITERRQQPESKIVGTGTSANPANFEFGYVPATAIEPRVAIRAAGKL
jgi:PAS domain S-box-containing protein